MIPNFVASIARVADEKLLKSNKLWKVQQTK